MASDAAEDYLRRIYLLQEEQQRDLLPMGELADGMGVVPGTATAMVKKLAAKGLVRYEPYSGVCLSEEGQAEALHLIRRHRLIEVFLVETLGFDWSEIHDEANRLEHAISDHVLERIDAKMGHPQDDPHGDPIPDPQGNVREVPMRPLDTCSKGERLRIMRIREQKAEFLRFLDRKGLKPGARISVEDFDVYGDAIRLWSTNGNLVTLGTKAATKLLVATIPVVP